MCCSSSKLCKRDETVVKKVKNKSAVAISSLHPYPNDPLEGMNKITKLRPDIGRDSKQVLAYACQVLCHWDSLVGVIFNKHIRFVRRRTIIVGSSRISIAIYLYDDEEDANFDNEDRMKRGIEWTQQ
jgi:hypothetical protein